MVIRTAEAGEVPGRLHEGVEGVGFTHPAITQLGELRHLLQRRAGGIHGDFHGQRDGQLVIGERYGLAFRAVLHRNRRAPVALAGNTPVTQAIVGFHFATAKLGQLGGNGIERGLEFQAIELAGVNQRAVLGVSAFRDIRRIAVLVGHYRLQLNTVLGGKLPVALVVGGYGHHRAGAELHQYEVSHEYRNFFTA